MMLVTHFGFKNAGANKKTKYRNKDARKEGGPKAGDRKATHHGGDQHQDECINYQQEEAHR